MIYVFITQYNMYLTFFNYFNCYFSFYLTEAKNFLYIITGQYIN